MKTVLIAICAMFALTVASQSLAEHRHHKHKHGEAAPIAEKKAHHIVYHCPMHKDVTSNKPGKCPKCGMEMANMEKHGAKYHCPMHKDVISHEHGKCKKCKMELEEVKK